MINENKYVWKFLYTLEWYNKLKTASTFKIYVKHKNLVHFIEQRVEDNLA